MNTNEHIENRNRFSQEELTKYAGQYVAWSLDGKQIVAADKDPIQLCKNVLALGYQSDEVVLSSVDGEFEE
jgi:hypothetical protein